jgi:hypothetical protein
MIDTDAFYCSKHREAGSKAVVNRVCGFSCKARKWPFAGKLGNPFVYIFPCHGDRRINLIL